MEQPPSLMDSLKEASEKAARYEWVKAAEIYNQAGEGHERLEDAVHAAEAMELAASSYFNGAFQTPTRGEFQHFMSLSEKNHQKAAGLYQSIGSEALAKSARARALFAKFWALDERDQRRGLLERCMLLAQESTRSLQVHGDSDHLPASLLDLLVYQERAVHLSRERRQLVDLFESAVETAWRIIEDESLNRHQIVLEASRVLAHLYLLGDFVLEQPRYEELERKLQRLKDRIPELSERIGTASADTTATEILLVLAADLEGDVDKTLLLFEKGLARAKQLGDKYLIGRFEVIAAAMTRWGGLGEEYSDKRRKKLERAIELSENAIENLQPSEPFYWLKRAYGIHVDAYNYLALSVETDLDKKRSVLREAIDETRGAMKYEGDSFVTGMGHQLSRAMYLLAMMDLGLEEKTRLLKEALPIREETVKTMELLSPHSFSRGAMLNYLALIKSELSKLETDPDRKLGLLKEASSDMEQCVKLCATITGIVQRPAGQVRAQAQYTEWQGDILQQLYDLTLDTSIARQAVHAYGQSIHHLSKSDNLGPIPPVRWKIAQTYDLLREYGDSSESFHQAAQEYRMAGKKIAGLANVFEDFAHYMEAWAAIEDARLHHDREQYSASAESYTKAAGILRTLKNWGHLSKHYAACSFLELGEAMSRQEREQAAIESFNAAKTNFHESSADLDQAITNSPASEKRELSTWREITQGRLNYAVSRLQLEEAKVLDARMEEEASAAKYRIASEGFKRLLGETRHPATRAELETLSVLCDAWAKMKSAESSASPELYGEAAASFRLVNSKQASKKTKLAALANASMCEALQSGMVFRRTRDKQLYQAIKTNLETAADFYEEAGIRKEADWTRATQRFFDALTYLRDAEVETDPKKRAELLRLAENHLQLAATIYGEAGYAAKKQESLRHLERAREEKQLLLMPVEVLAESPTVADVAISPLSLAEDRSIGLGKFEEAHVVGSMALSNNDVHAGDRLTIEFQIVNIGKTPATLERIENLVTKGLELLREKGEYSIEDHTVDFRGKRLEYLKSYQLKVPIRAKRKGTFQLLPRITFLDEKGRNSSFQFEPVLLRVEEIGILGWIRGPS